MRLSPGSCDRKLRILLGACVMQTRDQIARQKRTVRRCAQDPRNLRPVRGGPVEGSENPRQWSRKILDCVGNDGQAKRREPCRISIGIEYELFALRLQPCDHAVEDGTSGDL